MLPEVGDPLRKPFFLTVYDVDNGERQQPLGRLLQRGIEHLVHFLAQQRCSHGRGDDPEQRYAKPDEDRQPCLKRTRRPHVVPSR